MVSVIRVYNAVRDICNKDQKGFVSPAVFNRLAEIAQQNVFNEMFDELKIASKIRQSGTDAGRDKSSYKMLEEDLSRYITKIVVNVAGEEAPQVIYNEDLGIFEDIPVEEEAVYDKPTNLHRVISMHVADTNTSVELLFDEEKAFRVLNSNLSAPTEQFPVALLFGSKIHVFPQTISSDVVLVYYSKPGSVQNGVRQASAPNYSSNTISDGFVVPDEPNSSHFDLPSHYFPEVVAEICKMIGVRLRDNVLSQYGVTETNSK